MGLGASMFHRSEASNQRSGTGRLREAGQAPPSLWDLLAECHETQSLLSRQRGLQSEDRTQGICRLRTLNPQMDHTVLGKEIWQKKDHMAAFLRPNLNHHCESEEREEKGGPGMKSTQMMTRGGNASSQEAED